MEEISTGPAWGHIRVRGARENNLRDVNLDIPKRSLTVFTGVSGSGKSSLVFETIAAESQRLMNETYSAFVQSFMGTPPRPDVDTLFAKRLLEPLGLTETTFALDAAAQERKVPGFKTDGMPAHAWNFDCLKACGGLNSNAEDMLHYAEATMGMRDTPLRGACALAMQPWRETCEGERSIGLGWYVQPMSIPPGVPLQPETRLVWHGGATGGYRSFLGLMPEREAALVVLSNSTADVDPPLTWPVLKALLREIGTP